jgi:hypothetical protein
MVSDEKFAETVSKIKGDTEIHIRLPLPLDIVGTLGELIGTVYPNSRIATNREDFVILISNDERRVRLTDEQIAATFHPSANPEDEASFNGFRTEGEDLVAQFGLTQAASLQLASFCRDMLSMEGAKNYVEFECQDSDNKKYWVAACRSEGQTPHKLRMIAEAKLEALKGLHEPFGIYDECDHTHTDEEAEDQTSGVLFVDEVGLTCHDGLMYNICKTCCWREHFGQTEECAGEHEHGKDSPICETSELLER